MTPSDAGGGTEVTGGSYARLVTTGKWASASAGSITTSADLDFGTASASWGTIVAVGLLDASTVGNFLWWGPLSASKTINSGDAFKIPAGSLTLSLD